jgi:cytochrome c peroxidase
MPRVIKSQLTLAAAVAGLLLAASVAAGQSQTTPPQRPRLSVLSESIPAPEDNPTTEAKVELGRKLFFDTRLSGDNQISCATCHQPDKAFGDGLPRGRGVAGKPLARNTPTLLNVAFLSAYFWDGRAGSLEQQALMPIRSDDEMHQDTRLLVTELAADPDYVRQFEQVFGKAINEANIAKALAAFQRSLVRRNSPLDRYLAGDRTALTATARRGLELFIGEADCVRCHHGPLLSDGKYYRLGVGHGDRGRGAVTRERDDDYKFRTAPLRDIALTAPYMHDGSQKTLFDVVEFYFRRAPARGPDDLELDIEPLVDQSYSDIDALVEFLRALTGEPP